MSIATLHPGIANMDPDSLCYRMYNELYHHFFDAQERKDDEHPYGVEEGDDTSVRLRNTAFGFARAITGGLPGDTSAGKEEMLMDYLKKTGGGMTGRLTANYGFEAGIDNTPVMETYRKAVTGDGSLAASGVYGIKINGRLEVGASHLFIGGKQLLSYAGQTDTAILSSGTIDFGKARLRSEGELLIKGNEVFHRGNANLETMDWRMKDGHIEGELSVKGKAGLSALLDACHGVQLGVDGAVFISMEREEVNVNRFLSFARDCGIRIDNKTILARVNEKDIQLSAPGGELMIGNGGTNGVRLLSGLTDTDGDYLLISPYGAAYFPDSLTVRHNYGDELLSTYRVDAGDEGVAVHKKLRFGSSRTAYLCGQEEGIVFSSAVEHISSIEKGTLSYDTLIKYLPSTSRHKPLNRQSDTLSLSTTADFVLFAQPVETKGHIGIDGSLTRLTDGCLFFSAERYLLASDDGIAHYGHARFLSGLSSETFSSGMPGSGWAILRNPTDGNVSATFDLLTVRKKMRIYELEVQKIGVTNGSLWVSDHCEGERVIQV
jgi:hypothetical protein